MVILGNTWNLWNSFHLPGHAWKTRPTKWAWEIPVGHVCLTGQLSSSGGKYNLIYIIRSNQITSSWEWEKIRLAYVYSLLTKGLNLVPYRPVLDFGETGTQQVLPARNRKFRPISCKKVVRRIPSGTILHLLVCNLYNKHISGDRTGEGERGGGREREAPDREFLLILH